MDVDRENKWEDDTDRDEGAEWRQGTIHYTWTQLHKLLKQITDNRASEWICNKEYLWTWDTQHQDSHPSNHSSRWWYHERYPHCHDSLKTPATVGNCEDNWGNTKWKSTLSPTHIPHLTLPSTQTACLPLNYTQSSRDSHTIHIPR